MFSKIALLMLPTLVAIVLGKLKKRIRQKELPSPPKTESKYLEKKRLREEATRDIIRLYTTSVFEEYIDSSANLDTIITAVDKWTCFDSQYAPSPEKRIRIPEGMTKTDIMHFGKNMNIDIKRPRIDVACLMKSLFIDFENDEYSSLIARMSDHDRKHTIPIFDKKRTLKENMNGIAQ